MRKRVHPLAVPSPMPFTWHRNMAEVQLTEKLQVLAAAQKLNGGHVMQLRRLLERATFPTCRDKEPESVA